MKAALTNRGWSLLGAGLALLAGARILGVVELAMLAAAALVAVALAYLRIRRRAVSMSAQRALHPARAEAGTPARANLTLTNTGGRRTRILTATDSFDGGRRVARFLVPPLAAGESGEAAYRMPTARRGVFRVGPLTLSMGDPFGIAEASTVLAGSDLFVVYPKVTEVLPIPGSATRDARVGSSRASRVPVGLDFFGLREYEVGDDLRRVHWRSTARTGDLMLRQDEMPWESRATVLLDTRVATHAGESFERAVEVAASILTAVCRGRRHVRFLTTGGFEVRSNGRERYAAVMEFLAGVEPSADDRFSATLAGLRRSGENGPLAAVVANVARSDLSALGALGPRLGTVLVAALRPSAYGGSDAGPAPVAPGAIVVPVSSDTPFRDAWNQAVLSCQRSVSARS